MSADLELAHIPSSKSLPLPASVTSESFPDSELYVSVEDPDYRGGPRELENFREAIALPPVDRGSDAWRFVFCSFVLDCLVWGLGFTFGIYQEYYLNNPPFQGSSEAAVNSIGTTAVAIQYMEIVLVILVFQRWPHLVQSLMWGGLALCVLSLLLASFATKVWHLLVLQGVLYGIGGGILYAPVVLWLSEWFVTRRALAGSIIFGGSGLSGAIFPIITNALLARTGGFRWTLRAFAAIIGVLGGLALLGMKPRLPVVPRNRTSRAHNSPVDWSFLTSPLFLCVSFCVLLQALGNSPVSLYMPAYTAALGYSRLDGTLVLTVLNISNVVGAVMFGFLSDRFPYHRVMTFSALLSGLAALLLWGFAHHLKVVYSFVVVFGIISGGFASTCPPASADIAGSQYTLAGSKSSSMIFGCMGVFKGLAFIIGPIIAAIVHKEKGARQATSTTFGGLGFTGVVIFVSCMMAATTAGSILSGFLRRASPA